jgi:hypothetical protein
MMSRGELFSPAFLKGRGITLFEYKLTLNRVRDKLKVVESGEELLLTVDADAARMVAGLTKAQKELKSLTNDSTDEERTAVAKNFAAAIFGGEQADKLLDFYHGDALCVVDVCGRYFAQRLSKLISKAHKRMK